MLQQERSRLARQKDALRALELGGLIHFSDQHAQCAAQPREYRVALVVNAIIKEGTLADQHPVAGHFLQKCPFWRRAAL